MMRLTDVFACFQSSGVQRKSTFGSVIGIVLLIPIHNVSPMVRLSFMWSTPSIHLIHKSQNASVPYPTMHYSEQKCVHAHFCSELCIVGYGIGAFWDLWNWSFGWSFWRSAPQRRATPVYTAWYTSGLNPLIYSRVYIVPCIHWFSSNTTCFIFYTLLGPRCPNKLLNWFGLNSPVYSGRDLIRPILMPVRRTWRTNEDMTCACFHITGPS